jgi:SAM-dependent methyltransferase
LDAPMSMEDWHDQFLRQAQWTQAVRSQLYRRSGLLRAERVLDVGCGTGAITEELARRTRGAVTGLDIDPRMVSYARQHGQGARYEQGDVLDLPYPDRHFDIVACHFLLLWVADPQRAVCEMARVTKRRGSVLICAEPDYGGRIDWPALPIRDWQIDGLRRQGADPLIGRRLRALLVAAGLQPDVGIVPSQWDIASLHAQSQAEWALLRRDVGGAVDAAALDEAEAHAQAAIESGMRLVFVPIFCALARVT